MANKKSHKLRTIAALGALAAVGYYFYASKHAKQNRAKVAGWAKDFKEEVVVQLQHAKEINRETIGDAVDRALDLYKGLKNIDTSELLRAGEELKDHWKEFAVEVAKESTRSVRVLHRGMQRAMRGRKNKQ